MNTLTSLGGISGQPASLAHSASDSPALILGLFEAQARSRPHELAISSGDIDLTYADLDRRASCLAAHLQKLGARREVVVAICLERSADFVVAALASFKCGAAYLPMDPAHPTERLRFVLEAAGASLLVTNAKHAARFAEANVNVIALETDEPAISSAPDLLVPVDPQPDDLAYVIYTSGSTGQPKGVEITHRNLANLIAWHLRAFAMDASSRASFQAGVGFDAAVWEIWPALAVGASLHLPNDETRMSAEALRNWLVDREITISFVPTNLAEQLIALPWPAATALRFLLTGADTLQRFPARDLPFALVNNYGPTEGTVVATSGVITADDACSGVPTIGQPIDGVDVYLLDEHGHEVPTGVTGEIYLGGAGVARGYRNQPELTAERFVSGRNESGTARLYLTGDLARRSSDGTITFLGRVDDQVKIRGYRIELNEINALLNRQGSVRSCLVVARDDGGDGKRLIAYVIAAEGCAADEQTLRDACRRCLPDYMEPAAFVWLRSFPLTANGKIDRAALPPPSADKNFRDEPVVAPRTPVEEQLAAIICDVLRLPRVSVRDDFFNLGAHSLLGAQIIARVRGSFGVELKLLDVFDSPTIAELALKIEDALSQKLGGMSDAEVEAALASFAA
ncbi:MAG: non-ribosomal peptide synthetase [Verrucomicrobiota bacterium]|nr:non-ribosomal peptide synthetase [Verrucomicrobiota bacterium]